MTNNTLSISQTALDRLTKTTERSSLDSLVTARTQRSLLLVDVSGSMSDTFRDGEGIVRKIDKLRTIVETLQTTHPVPVAAFGINGYGVELVERIPEPSGMTPLHKAIDFGRIQEATHLVVVTDGQPDDAEAALNAAKFFGGKIDVFYIGSPGTAGAAFCEKLAKLAGGSCGVTDLTGEPKKLAAGIAGLLTAPGEVL